MNNEQNTQGNSEPHEQEIDLIELAQKVWAGRKLVYKVCGIAIIVGLVVAFSIPKEYSTKVTIAPEMGDSKGMSGGMGTLASMAGINLGSSGANRDALYPDLYPDIVASIPFLIELFDVKVVNKKSTLNTNLYTYMDEHQRSPWWGYVTSAPFRLLSGIISLFVDEDPQNAEVVKADPFALTKDQARVAEAISDRIASTADKKSGIITLTVTMQDPLISATLTDSVLANLQTYITEYRTNKARHDLAFTEKLYKEAKANYYKAQQAYASFVDANKNVVLASFRTEQERLQNEMSLSYGLYNQVAQQLQMAKAKVQEITPVYTIVQPATVPLQPSKPSKPMILIGFVSLAAFASIGWILLKDMLKGWKKIA